MSQRSGWAAALAGAILLVAACKDEDPCDPGYELKETGCFPVGGSAGGAGRPATSEGGEPAGGDTATLPDGGEPAVGNPDASFGTKCESNAQCGGDAPVCATDPLFYCSQIDCEEGEANAGSCPKDWICFKYLDNPSACVNPSSL